MTATRLRHAALIAVLTLLPGCRYGYQQSTVLHRDRSGTMNVHYWETAEHGKSDRANPKDKEARKMFEAKGIVIGRLETTYDEKDSTNHMRAALSFEDVLLLNRAEIFHNAAFRWTEQDGRVRFEHEILESGAKTSLSIASFDEASYDYEFPGDIINCNADSVAGSHAFWKTVRKDANGRRIMRAEFELAPAWIGWLPYIGGGVLLVAVFLLIRRRKRPVA